VEKGGKTPQLRIVLLAQNCHRGERILRVALTPRNSRALEIPETILLEVPLQSAAVTAVFETRRMALREGALDFDLEARVRIRSLGWRVRLRRGISPKSKWLEPAQTLMHLPNPFMLAVHVAMTRNSFDQAPEILAAQEAPEPYPWPTDPVQPVWNPGTGWMLSGAARDWICQMSGRLAQMLEQGTPLPMSDGEGL
jgi:hypothetical protein